LENTDCYTIKPQAEAVIKLAQKNAANWDAEIDVVWVISRDTPIKHRRLKEWEQYLEDHAAAFLADSGIPYKTHLLLDTADIT
jgi:arsenate reductase-like glutaredoxin family protein